MNNNERRIKLGGGSISQVQLAGAQCCEHCCIQRDPHGARGGEDGHPSGDRALAVSSTKGGSHSVEGSLGVHGPGEELLFHRLMQSEILYSDALLCMGRGLCRCWREGAAVASVRPVPPRLLLAVAGGPGHCRSRETARLVVCASHYPAPHRPLECRHHGQLHRSLVMFCSDAGLYQLVWFLVLSDQV